MLYSPIRANFIELLFDIYLFVQYLKEHGDPVMREILYDTEHMLAHGRMDLPLTLCFAAARQDELLLHRLLKRGLEPNDLDSNGRSALVCLSLVALIVKTMQYFAFLVNLNSFKTAKLPIIWPIGCNYGSFSSCQY